MIKDTLKLFNNTHTNTQQIHNKYIQINTQQIRLFVKVSHYIKYVEKTSLHKVGYNMKAC